MKTKKLNFCKKVDAVATYFRSTKLNWLRISGLAMVSFGIGMIFLPAGFIAGGISLLLIEWSVEEDES